MNSKFLLAAIVAVASTAALADDITVDSTPFNSSRSRAEVQAELAQFKQSGVNPWSTSYNPLRNVSATTSRAQAQQDYIANREQVRALTGEDSGSAYLARGTQAVQPAALAGQPANAY